MEELIKADLTVDMLLSEVTEAHSAASNPFLEILLRDVLKETQALRNRISELRAASESTNA